MVEGNRFVSRRSRAILVALWWIPGAAAGWMMWSAFSWGGLLLFVLPLMWVSWDYVDRGTDHDVFTPGDWQSSGLGFGPFKHDAK